MSAWVDSRLTCSARALAALALVALASGARADETCGPLFVIARSLNANVVLYEARLRPAFEPEYLVNDPIRVGHRRLGAVIHVTAIGKADLVMRDPDPWGESAFARRVQIDDPALGLVWVSSIEDLLVAKLDFADGDAAILPAETARDAMPRGRPGRLRSGDRDRALDGGVRAELAVDEDPHHVRDLEVRTVE